MQKVIIDNKVIVCLSDGNTIEKQCTDKEISLIENINNEEEIINILYPQIRENKKKAASINSFLAKVQKSQLLSLSNNSIYWPKISSLSLPEDLAKDIIKAEFNNNTAKIEAYKNFWVLMSLNTNEECRKNLYWFLRLHGLVIAKSGFFVAYRNVCKTKKVGIYTDYYTRTFRIKIGEMVVMDEKNINCDSNIECSRGLHCASAKWLKYNYCGDVGLACLVNPADVRAVPHNSEYGKLRSRAYLPIDTINFDDTGNVIPLDVETGFDCSYVSKVIYEGIMGTETDSPYKIIIPETIINKESIQNNLLDIALKSIANKWV